MVASKAWLNEIRWDEQGLLPVIVQEQCSGDVLMFAYMNLEALEKTIELRQTVFWSRSRKKLWHKGEESGNFQQVHEVRLDCDGDVILISVTQLGHTPGIACHTGRHSCFYKVLDGDRWTEDKPILVDSSVLYKSS